eukprot:g15925.t1
MHPASGAVRTPKASAHFGCDFLEIAEDVLQKREPDKFKEYKNGGGCTTTVDVDADDNYMFVPDEVQRGSSTIGGSTTAQIFGRTVEDFDNIFPDEVQRGSSTSGGSTTAQIFGRTADCFDIMRAPGEQGASSSTAGASWSAATPTPNHYASTPAFVQEETQQPEPLQHSRKGFSACRTTFGGLAYGKKLFAQALLHEHKNAVAAELRPPKKRAVLLDKKHKPMVAAAVSEVLSSTVARRSRSACSTASMEGVNKTIGGFYVESVYKLLQRFLPKRMSYTPHEKALKAWTGAALYIVAFGEQLPLTLKAICTVLKIRSPAGNKERAHDAATGTSKADPAGIGGSGGGRSKQMQKKVAAICAEFPGEVEKPCPFAVQDFCEIDKVMQRLPMLVGSSAWREMREMEAAEERLAEVETARSSSRKQDDLAVKALAWAAAEYKGVPESVWKQISRGAIALATVARVGAVCNNAGSNRSTTALAAACVYLSIQMAMSRNMLNNGNVGSESNMNANVHLATFSSAAGGGGHLRLKKIEEFVTLEQMAYFIDQSHSGIYAKVADMKKIFLGACEGLPWHAGASSNANSKPQPEVLSSASASSGARGGVFGSRDSVLYPCKPVMFPELQAVQRLYQTAQTAERSSLRSHAAAARRVVQAARDAELLTPALEATMVHDIIGAKLRLRPTTFLQDAEKIQGLLDAQKAAVQARAAAEQARRLAECDKQRGALALPGLEKKQVFGSLANKKPVSGRSAPAKGSADKNKNKRPAAALGKTPAPTGAGLKKARKK